MITKALSKQLKALWNDESAQGSTEYILLLVVVVTIAILFKDKIKVLVGDKLNQLGEGMSKITPEG